MARVHVGPCPNPFNRVDAAGRQMSMRCKSRKCSSCGQLWAGDQRKRLVANLDAYCGPVWMATVTAPGKDVLRHDPDGKVSFGAAYWFNKQCPRRWRELHHRAAQETRRATGRRPTVLAWVWQYQARGVLHKHVVLGVGTAAERRAADVYVGFLAALAGEHRFGYVDRGRWDQRKRRRCLREMTGKHAGRYVAKYLVQRQDDGSFAVSETVTHDDVPPLIVYVTQKLTSATGITMRSLRGRRLAVVMAERLELDLGEVLDLMEQGVRVAGLRLVRGP